MFASILHESQRSKDIWTYFINQFWGMLDC